MLGTVVHQLLEDHLEVDVPVDNTLLSTLQEHFPKVLEELDTEHLVDQPLIDAGNVMLTEFVDRHMNESFSILAKEMPFEVVIGTGLFRGFIDRVDVTDDTIYICDYKTGKWEVSFKDAPNNLQIGLYALAMRKMYPEIPKIYAELYYLRSGRQKGHLFTEGDLEEVESRLLGLTNQVIHQNNFAYTAEPRSCSFCDFASNGTCPVGVKRYRGNQYR